MASSAIVPRNEVDSGFALEDDRRHLPAIHGTVDQIGALREVLDQAMGVLEEAQIKQLLLCEPGSKLQRQFVELHEEPVASFVVTAVGNDRVQLQVVSHQEEFELFCCCLDQLEAKGGNLSRIGHHWRLESDHLQDLSSTGDVLVDDLRIPTDEHRLCFEEPLDALRNDFEVEGRKGLRESPEELGAISFTSQGPILLIGDGDLLEYGRDDLAIGSSADGEAYRLPLELDDAAVLVHIGRHQLGEQVCRKAFHEDVLQLGLSVFAKGLVRHP